MPRQARLDAPGILQHVIVKGLEGRQILAEGRDRKDFITRMGDLALELETKVYAWALMRNHIHILLRAGSGGLATYMHRLLTGYAITYNRRHSRRGYLFQDRYKSIVCDEDRYFKELVRYIHLNPLRAKIVKDLSELDRYPWCGHSVLLGIVKHSWQDTDYVLSWFGKRQGSALRAYRQYLLDGISQGRRPELVGGVKDQSEKGRDRSDKGSRDGETAVDQRILGDEVFITKVKKEFFSHEREKPFDFREIKEKIQSIVEVGCREGDVQTQELQMGSRRQQVAEMRAGIARQLVNELGISLREVAYHLGVSSSAISKMLHKRSFQRVETGRWNYSIYSPPSPSLEKVEKFVSYAQLHVASPDLAKRRAKVEDFRNTPYVSIPEVGWKLRFISMTPAEANEPDIVDAFAKAAARVELQTPTGPQLDMVTIIPMIHPRLIPVPTMVIHGEYDDVADLEGLLPFFKQLPNPYKRYVVIPDAGHMMHLQKGHRLFQHEVSGFFKNSFQ